jgi:hypothetical protein
MAGAWVAAHDPGPPVATRCTELGYLNASTAADLAGIHRFVFANAPARNLGDEAE